MLSCCLFRFVLLLCTVSCLQLYGHVQHNVFQKTSLGDDGDVICVPNACTEDTRGLWILLFKVFQ